MAGRLVVINEDGGRAYIMPLFAFLILASECFCYDYIYVQIRCGALLNKIVEAQIHG
jgi:hypothetical protein